LSAIDSCPNECTAATIPPCIRCYYPVCTGPEIRSLKIQSSPNPKNYKLLKGTKMNKFWMAFATILFGAFLSSPVARALEVAPKSQATALQQTTATDQDTPSASRRIGSAGTPFWQIGSGSNPASTDVKRSPLTGNQNPQAECLVLDNGLTTCDCPFGPDPSGTGCFCPNSRPVCPMPGGPAQSGANPRPASTKPRSK